METSLDNDIDWSKATRISRDFALDSLRRQPPEPAPMSLKRRFWSILDNGFVQTILGALILPFITVGSFAVAWWLLNSFFPR